MMMITIIITIIIIILPEPFVTVSAVAWPLVTVVTSSVDSLVTIFRGECVKRSTQFSGKLSTFEHKTINYVHKMSNGMGEKTTEDKFKTHLHYQLPCMEPFLCPESPLRQYLRDFL